jgi:membrane protein
MKRLKTFTSLMKQTFIKWKDKDPFNNSIVIAYYTITLSAALSAFSGWVSARMSISITFIFNILDIGVSLAVISLLFAAMFKFLPDAKIEWKDVWPGAIFTSALFVLAKFALGIYFEKSEPGSMYGAAGSIILIMLWVS